MLIFFAWVIFIWIAITVLIDVFRRHDLSGWGKAGWSIFVVILPWLGVLIYLIVNHQGMADRARRRRRQRRPSSTTTSARRDAAPARRRDREGQEAARRRHDHPGRVRRIKTKALA